MPKERHDHKARADNEMVMFMLIFWKLPFIIYSGLKCLINENSPLKRKFKSFTIYSNILNSLPNDTFIFILKSTN